MRITARDKLYFDLDLEHTIDADLRRLTGQQLAGLIESTAVAIDRSPASQRREDTAAMHMLARAFAKEGAPGPGPVLDALVLWLKRQGLHAHLLFLAVAEQHVDGLRDLLEEARREHPEISGTLVGALWFLPEPLREAELLKISADTRQEVRINLFSVLNKHRRLVPPGSITWDCSDGTTKELLSMGIDDPVPKVRERALALAYGLGRVPLVRELVLQHVDDADVNARQYALIALGILDDAESREILLERLRRDVQMETTAAIWALARRPDGVEHVLALLPDSREWVVSEVLGAIKLASAPLDDHQIAALRASVQDPDLSVVLDHHLWRTRDPQGREVGPDGQVSYQPGARFTLPGWCDQERLDR